MEIKNWRQNDDKYICPICKKTYSKNGIGTHYWRKHGGGKNFKPVEKDSMPWNKGKKTGYSWNKGKQTGISTWNRMTSEQQQIHRERARKNIQKRYDNGWDPKAGRAPKYKYKNFTVDGSWELEFCR